LYKTFHLLSATQYNKYHGIVYRSQKEPLDSKLYLLTETKLSTEPVSQWRRENIFKPGQFQGMH